MGDPIDDDPNNKYNAVFGYTFSIFVIILSYVKSNSCNIIDPDLNLTPQDYLFGYGIITLLYAIFLGISINDEYPKYKIIKIIIVLIPYFNFIWFILGSIVLFRNNIICIQQKSYHAISALVIWTFYTVCFLIMTFREIKKKIKE